MQYLFNSQLLKNVNTWEEAYILQTNLIAYILSPVTGEFTHLLWLKVSHKLSE